MKRTNITITEDQAIEFFYMDGYYVVNKTLVSELGIVAAFIFSILVDTYKYASNQGALDDGMFYLKLDSIEKKSGLSKKTIYNHLLNFIEIGFITKKRKGNAGRNYYQIHFNTLLAALKGGFPESVKITGSNLQKLQDGDSKNYRLETVNFTGLNNNNKNIKTDNIKTKEKKLNKKRLEKFNLEIPDKYDFDDSKIKLIIDWLEYKKEKGQKYVQRGFSALLSKIQKYSTEELKVSIENSMSCNYQGLFFDTKKQQNTSNRKRSDRLRYAADEEI